MQIQDNVNRRCYVLADTLDWLSSAPSFCDPGEHAAYWHVVDEIRGSRILDIGVGTGRTIALLRPLTEHYVAIDYLPEMVESARSRYPFVDTALGDARDLSQFADEHFDVVTFSFNGIDSIAHEDRTKVIAEAHRVLRPGGLFWFSTLNRQGPNRRHRPWLPRRPREVGGRLRYPLVALRALWSLPVATRNYFRNTDMAQQGDGWELSTLDAHSYGLLVHYTTLERQLTELTAAGFRIDPEVFGSDGHPVEPGSDLSKIGWFQILARK